MTSRELTSSFDFWSRGHLRMAMMHLPINFDADIFIQPGVIDIFPKLKMAAAGRQPPSWIFRHSGVLIVWYLCSVPNLVQISVIATEIDALIFRPSFDDVTRINFRLRLLFTWSSPHGRGESSHKIWCIYIYPIRSYWHFSDIKDGGRRHLWFVGSHGTTRKGAFVVRTPCKNFVMIG